MTNKQYGKIRIIGGRWRGRKLFVAPNEPGLRPTANIIRETLFNWLAPIIDGAYCLDCFAGSGALGLEALSRHAAHVTLLEYNHTIYIKLLENISRLQVTPLKFHVINTDSLLWLSKPREMMFNLVFIDPPFYRGIIDKTIRLLEDNNHLVPEAFIYIETEISNIVPVIPKSWQMLRQKKSGHVIYRLYKRSIIL